jgi:flagellar assembly protein FliH
MSSVSIPKEQQTAYQRWEMSSFAEGQATTAKKRDQPLPEVQQQLKLITESARKDGYAQGLGEGYAAGMQQALEAMQADKQALTALTAALDQTLQKSDQQIAEHLLQLALDITRAMLKQKLAIDETAVLPIVTEAIQSLPYVQQPASIRIHPLDAAAVRHYIAETQDQPWHIVEDAHIERGGCQIETGANQVDAGNAMRWKRISEALGQASDWNAP